MANSKKVNIYVKGILGEIKLSFLKTGFFSLKDNNESQSLSLGELDKIRYFIKKEFNKTFLKKINETLIGVNYGWKAKLRLKGRGIKIFVFKDSLYLDLGYSHAFRYLIPKGIQIGCFKKGFDYELSIIGLNKSLIGNILFKIRSLNSMNPYKEKGIIYSYETFSLKQGKKWVRG